MFTLLTPHFSHPHFSHFPHITFTRTCLTPHTVKTNSNCVVNINHIVIKTRVCSLPMICVILRRVWFLSHLYLDHLTYAQMINRLLDAVGAYMLSFVTTVDWASTLLVCRQTHKFGMSVGARVSIDEYPIIAPSSRSSLWRLRLHKLSIQVSDITDITCLASMTTVRALEIAWEPRDRYDHLNMSSLSMLSELTSLCFHRSTPSDLNKMLRTMNNMRVLFVSRITNVVANMTTLTELHLAYEVFIEKDHWNGLLKNRLIVLKCPHLRLDDWETSQLVTACGSTLKVLHFWGVRNRTVPNAKQVPFMALEDLCVRMPLYKITSLSPFVPPSLRHFTYCNENVTTSLARVFQPSLESFTLSLCRYELDDFITTSITCPTVKKLRIQMMDGTVPSLITACFPNATHVEIICGRLDPLSRLPNIHSLVLELPPKWTDAQVKIQELPEMAPNLHSLTIRSAKLLSSECLSIMLMRFEKLQELCFEQLQSCTTRDTRNGFHNILLKHFCRDLTERLMSFGKNIVVRMSIKRSAFTDEEQKKCIY